MIEKYEFLPTILMFHLSESFKIVSRELGLCMSYFIVHETPFITIRTLIAKKVGKRSTIECNPQTIPRA